MYEDIEKQAAKVTEEICRAAGLAPGQILVVGCSTSEVCGEQIGSKCDSPAQGRRFLCNKDLPGTEASGGCRGD